MGNAGDIKENNEIIKIEDIIENDCYEEIDLKKINRLIEEEKNWNKNSIIYSVNQLDLQKLNDENNNEQKENQKNDPLNNIIEEPKNEDRVDDDQNKENIIEDKNNININNDNKNEKEEKLEKNELNEKNEENLTFEKIEIKNNNINQEETNKNVPEKKDENIINNEQNKNIKEEKHKNNLDKNKNNTNGNHQMNGKINKYSIKMKNIKPKIRPKNTSDEALKGLNSPKGTKKPIRRRKKKEISTSMEDKTKNNNSQDNVNKENNENKTNNDNNYKTEEEKKVSVSPIEKRDPSEEFDIKNIISEYRLNHLKDDEIIYSGTLEKILKIPEKNSIVYSQRFCIFTKNYFAYYKSKESYISLNKPMLMINNNFIIRIENTTLDGGSYYFGIICEVNDETRSLINKVNSFVTEEANNCELLLGFRTKEYENMMKWVVVLRYFTTNQNEEF